MLPIDCGIGSSGFVWHAVAREVTCISLVSVREEKLIFLNVLESLTLESRHSFMFSC